MLRHKFLLHSLLLLAAVLPCFGPSLAAQDLTLDLKTGGPRTEGAVTVTYKWYEEGANIDKGGTINNVLDISSTKDIVRIDFEGAVRRAGGVVVLNNNGTLDFQPQGTSKWTGKSSHIVFAAADDNAEYFISGIRIWYEGSTAFLATPTIAYEGGQFTISSTTPGATCHYSLTPNATQAAGIAEKNLPLQTFTLSAYASAQGMDNSETATLNLTLDELLSGSASAKKLTRHEVQAANPFRAPLAGASQQEPVRTFKRNKVLVEKHTGLDCLHCPSADQFYAQFLANHPGYEDKIVLMRHNSYTMDELQVPAVHQALRQTWIIQEWPSYLIDRCNANGYKYYSPVDYKVDFNNFSSSSWDDIAKRLAKPTYVSLSLEGSAYDPATRKLTVRARGEVTTDVPDLAINVFLTQDNMKDNPNHAYQNSSRACLTSSVNGETLTVENGKFNYTKEYTLNTSYGRIAADPDNMHLVVFISSFDDYTYPEKDGKKDYFNSEVHNADEVALSELPKTTGPDCDTPVISLKKGALQFSSATEGAAIHYTLAPIEGTIAGGNVSCADVAFEVTAVAKADYHAPSLHATATYTLADVQASFTPKESPIVFVNPCDGMEYGDGETMIITPEIDAEWGDVMFPAPALRNKSAEDITANLHYSINMPHGSFSECISGKCYSRDANGDYTSGNFIIPAGKDISSLCEWSCGYTDTWDPKTGTCITNFTLYVEGEEGPTVTVKYVYDTRPVMVNTIGSAGYSTLYADRALSIPVGLKAYTATEDNGCLKTIAIEDGIIPARTGVILEGSAKPYVFYAAPNYGTSSRGCLKGVLSETTNPGGTYVLSSVNSRLGFYKYAEDAKLKANRAYYQPSVASVSAFLLDFDETLTTGIDELSDVKYQKNNTYDLTGRAVNSARNVQRGIVIAGDKKIIQ